MIMVKSKLRSADNAGGLLFKCIRVDGGFKRRYAGLGEMVGSVSKTRKAYRMETNKAKAAKVARKVKKTRKKKDKKFRPYLNLLVSLKKSTKRRNGTYIKFDENRIITLKEPRTFGPAGKTENIPDFFGTKIYGPTTLELLKNKTMKARFKHVISRSGGVV